MLRAPSAVGINGAWLLLGLLAACGSGDDERRPAAPATGGMTTGGAGSRAGSKATPEAGESGEAGQASDAGAGGQTSEGGAAGEGGIVYEMGGLPQNMPGICGDSLKPKAAQPVDVGVSDATLLAISADELSAVLATGSDDALALHVADRATDEAAFTAMAVPIPEGYAATQGASISGDGLRLVLPRDDFSGFGELSRAARGEAFSADADETRFARINAQKPMSGRSVAWPVLSDDGTTLYFVSYFGYALVKQATLANGAFSDGTEIDEFTLGGAQGQYKLISGLASDQRAIFFFDEATGHAHALFRARPDAPFYDPVDLGQRRGVAPSADCKRLYSSTAAGVVVQAL